MTKMGLVVPQTVRVKTSRKMCKYYREKGYEFEKYGDFIEVDVFDLHPRSTVKVKVICDICGKEREIQYRFVVKCNEENELITCASNSCTNKKREDTYIKKYGVNHPSKVQEIQDKKKKTCQLHFGCDWPSQDRRVKEKIKKTNLEKYGSESPLGSKEIQNKSKKTWQKKYGENITSPTQVESIKNKIKETNLERYGSENPFGSKEIQNKLKKTWQEKYGENIVSISQVKEIQDKIKETNNEKYGCNCVFQSKKVKDKIKQTMLKKYGVDNPMQVEEIKNKVLDSFQINGTGPSSRAQRYICYISNGILNKSICGSLVDIYIEKENIVIEHDGGGHFLRDKMNKEKGPTKESLLYEKQREDKIINNGYRMIRFIATKDRIPSDEVILNLIEEFKNSDFKVVRINFEEGTIDRDYEEKWYCNFGELRKITQKDLEKFEKQEKNISEN